MANKRKYPEVQGYWVYSIKIPSNNKYYIGVSGAKKCCQRFAKNKYETCSLNQYLNEWDSMEKTVLVDNLTKEQAYQYEDNIIRALKMNNLCINEQISGLIEANDINAYKREYRKNNTEYRERQNQIVKQWRLNNPEYKKQRYQNDAEYRERTKQQVKQYQLENKEQINEKRRQRYQNDSEFREKKREYDKQRYERKKLEKQQINN